MLASITETEHLALLDGWQKHSKNLKSQLMSLAYVKPVSFRSEPAKYFANETFPAVLEVKNLQLLERQETFLWQQIKKLSIKFTSLSKYFAGSERNDEVENGHNRLVM